MIDLDKIRVSEPYGVPRRESGYAPLRQLAAAVILQALRDATSPTLSPEESAIKADALTFLADKDRTAPWFEISGLDPEKAYSRVSFAKAKLVRITAATNCNAAKINRVANSGLSERSRILAEQAMQLRLKGMNNAAIGRQLGFSGPYIYWLLKTLRGETQQMKIVTKLDLKQNISAISAKIDENQIKMTKRMDEGFGKIVHALEPLANTWLTPSTEFPR